jgi:hypothetical protein
MDATAIANLSFLLVSLFNLPCGLKEKSHHKFLPELSV